MLCALLLSLGVVSQPTRVRQEEQPAPPVKPYVLAETRDFEDTFELDGRVVPASGEEASLWLEGFSGELLFLEVRPHGSFVNTGDVVARLDTERLDEQITDAELELNSAEIRHAATAERARIDAEAADAKRREVEQARARARRALEGWEQHELALKERGDALSRLYTKHNIEDQEDELKQLEAMYRDDELVDATEEIVLKRSRRNLARTITNLRLSEDSVEYETAFQRAAQTEQKQQAVEKQEGVLERLVRSQELDRRGSEDGVLRSEVELGKKRRNLERLQRDREQFTIRAPRDGVLLHGGLRDQGVGQTRPEHRRGDKAPRRSLLFTFTDPDPTAVAVAVEESRLHSVRPGMSARVRPVVEGGAEVLGTLELDRFPTRASGAKPACKFAGTVRLERAVPGVVVGMRAKLELVGETLADVVVLPSAAVFGAGDEAHCWVASGADEAYRRVAVELGPRRGNEVVVTAGVAAGQRVLVGRPGEAAR